MRYFKFKQSLSYFMLVYAGFISTDAIAATVSVNIFPQANQSYPSYRDWRNSTRPYDALTVQTGNVQVYVPAQQQGHYQQIEEISLPQGGTYRKSVEYLPQQSYFPVYRIDGAVPVSSMPAPPIPISSAPLNNRSSFGYKDGQKIIQKGTYSAQ